jgi:hypothetical protein
MESSIVVRQRSNWPVQMKELKAHIMTTVEPDPTTQVHMYAIKKEMEDYFDIVPRRNRTPNLSAIRRPSYSI